jgi:transcriptional regulator with XRE-family HTH domain
MLGVMSPTTYADVLARNVRAARSRKGLQQDQAAARMHALGYESWVRQTVANVEKGKRRITAEEIFGLAYALETSMSALMSPTDDDAVVDFPNGEAIAVVSVVRSAAYRMNDRAVIWDGDVPTFLAVPADLGHAAYLARGAQ